MMWLLSTRLLALAWVVGLASVAARLPDEESAPPFFPKQRPASLFIAPGLQLEALSVVANTLGKRDWNIGLDENPCTNLPPWWNNDTTSGVYCNCSTTQNTTTTCHVTRLVLKNMSMNGSLPPELVRLPFLEEFDLTRNYISGSIPPQWGSMQSLRIISLLGNLVTGQIPIELANITTLEELVLEANQINGTIPSELGNLPNIRRLVFNSNNLTGELPASLAQLTSLGEFRISGNNFRGSIPDYIQNWTNIERIEIQGSGLAGPIPSNLTSLTNLLYLRISDLNGSPSNFPNLSLSFFQSLILRSCNLVGEIPPFIGDMTIDELDLSFNNLTGQIPRNLADNLTGIIYLTGNSLNGTVPTFKTRKIVDLSYNTFTTESTSQCGDNGQNLFAKSKENNTATFNCVKQRNCNSGDDYHSFFINCGGGREGDYEDDISESSEFDEGLNWGYRNTGTFMDDTPEYGSFISKSNFSISGPVSQLYKDARISPLSLTYYGLCLKNGKYTVKLHFAEIMFKNYTTYGSPGLRIFDIYIQDTLVKKDYNIAKAAGGVFKAHIEIFTADVIDHTMEIRFYWAGKGTTSIPGRSVYGPLISAISVVHNNGGGLSGGAIAGIVMGVLFTILVLVLGILWWKGCLRRKDSMHKDLKGLDLQTGSFTLRQIKAATKNFNPANKIGEGGFGPVYKGVLLNGQVIAVKQLSSKSKQGNREFITEIGMISALQHPHLVKLYGCCIEGNQLLLVYEYCENNSLARALFGPEAYQLHLDWATRHMICIGIARGLAYLHEESRLKIVHRDIKATNVLLDENLVPKISDFGLAKLDEEDNTHISTRIAGTYGYMAPEYAMHGYLTDKADVYSFGVVLLEIVSGKSNSSIRPREQNFYLSDWANSLKAKGSLLELVDPRLELNFNQEEVTRAINVALLCTNVEAVERPSMSAVVSMLEGRVGVEKFVRDSSISIDKTKPEEISRGGEGQTISVDVPWSGSSASAPDLYSVAPDTSYWEKRGM